MTPVTAIIPVRLASARLARKALLELSGRPLLWHVWRQVVQADCFSDVIVATDSELVQGMAAQWGAKVILTGSECRNGTERIASIADRVDSDLIVNVQGDMPWIPSPLLQDLLRNWSNERVPVITPVFQIRSYQELRDPNQVKVVLADGGRAAYFSRQPIPFVRDHEVETWLDHAAFWGHVGIYGFSQSALQAYRCTPPGSLELSEHLEQLRFLDAGVPIATFRTTWVPIRVDNLADLDRARSCVSSAAAAWPRSSWST